MNFRVFEQFEAFPSLPPSLRSVKQRWPLVRVPDVVLLLLRLQMWPISLLWTMLAVVVVATGLAHGATARAAATGWARRGGICVRMRMLRK